jgi:protein-S-isoprenylcysteine O-methyltransferase Ste14
MDDRDNASEPQRISSQGASGNLLKFIGRRVRQNALSLFSLGVLFFVVAGTLKVIGFWLYAGTVLMYQIVSLLILVPRYPAYVELARIRKIRRTDVKPWDKQIIRILLVATFLMYGLAALDLGRVRLGILPLWIAPLGILFYAAGSALNQWAMIHNPHFEKEVRIQTDRAHQVIAAGPYRIVRHPGYLGSLLGYISFPLILGSALAFIGSALCIVGTMVRAYLEDRTLYRELDGYPAYARAVPHRLIPFVW